MRADIFLLSTFPANGAETSFCRRHRQIIQAASSKRTVKITDKKHTGCIVKKTLALYFEIYYYMICAWGYSSVGERSVRIRKAVSSNLIISIKQPASYGRLLSKSTSYVCSSVDRALDSGSRCAGSIPVRRAHGDMQSISSFFF